MANKYAVVLSMVWHMVCVCFANAQITNAIMNPGFETGALSPWFQANSLSPGVDWTVTSADAHSGMSSATNTGNKEIRQTFTAVPNSQITMISFWLRHPGGDISPSVPATTDVSLFYSDASQSHFLYRNSSTEWQFYDVTSLLFPGKSLVGLSIWGMTNLTNSPSQPATFVDDVAITFVPEPCGIPGIGLLLVIISAKRIARRVH